MFKQRCCRLSLFPCAAAQGNLYLVRLLLSKGARGSSFGPDLSGATPLHLAATACAADVVARVLSEARGLDANAHDNAVRP